MEVEEEEEEEEKKEPVSERGAVKLERVADI